MSSKVMKAPALTGLTYVKGDPLDIAAGKGTKAFVVEFWATWCPPCKATIPHLTELAHKFKGKVEFVGITNEDNESAIKSFVDKMGAKMDYSVAIDKSGTVTNEYMATYGVSGIPHAFIIDLEGNIIWNNHPADPSFEKTLDKITADISATANKNVAHHYSIQQLKTMTDSEMAHLSAKDLRGICQEYGIDTTACLEKSDYVEVIRASQH